MKFFDHVRLLGEAAKRNELRAVERSGDFLVGVEYEFYCPTRMISRLEAEVAAVAGEYAKDYDWTDDCTLEKQQDPGMSNGFDGVELQGPPIPFAEAERQIPAILNLIGKYGYTNDACGLHVTISYNAPEALRKTLDHRALVRSIEDEKVYKDMPSRKDNEWVRSFYPLYFPKGARSAFPAKKKEKYQSARVRDEYTGARNSKGDNVVEFRALGGRDYEKKWPAIRNAIINRMHHLKMALTDPKYMSRRMAKHDTFQDYRVDKLKMIDFDKLGQSDFESVMSGAAGRFRWPKNAGDVSDFYKRAGVAARRFFKDAKAAERYARINVPEQHVQSFLLGWGGGTQAVPAKPSEDEELRRHALELAARMRARLSGR